MNETIKLMDEETFKGIYTNEKLRNEIAFAHGVEGWGEYKKAMMYPLSYKVTDRQIKEAEELRLKRQKEVLKENKNNLLFCSMGMDFEPTFEDGVGNHRIRTEFKNSKGHIYFIELGTGKDGNLRIDHSIDRTKQDEVNDHFDKQHLFYNFAGLERKTPQLKYTYENVLKLVNEYFNCNFKRMVVDGYNIESPDFPICESPKVV
mgnify:CR=1 FL=1